MVETYVHYYSGLIDWAIEHRRSSVTMARVFSISGISVADLETSLDIFLHLLDLKTGIVKKKLMSACAHVEKQLEIRETFH